MLSLTRETQMDKAKKTLQDVVSYAEEVVRDERLRADLRAAAGHGAKAGERVKKNVDAGGITGRLADDKKLRRNLRAMLDDLESASDRVRAKKRHRLRNLLLIVVGAVALALLPKVRLWFSQEPSEGPMTSTQPPPLT